MGNIVADTRVGCHGQIQELHEDDGELKKIVIRNEATKRKKTVYPKDAVTVPPVQAYVRNTKSQFWYQVKSLQKQQAALVLILNKKPTESTPKTGENADAARTSDPSKTRVENADAARATNPSKTRVENADAARASDPSKTRVKDADVATGPIITTPDETLTEKNNATVKQFAEVVDVVEGTPDSPAQFLAREVAENPDKFLSKFLEYWGEHLPDTSEGRPPKLDELMFWKSCCASLKAHTTFPGMCAKWLHISLDFAIARNAWPVRFRKDLELYDMVTPFTLTVWVCYAAQMNGSPDLTSKAAQKVLLYMLTQPALVVNA